MNNFRVLKITNNLEDYPECERDTLEFPNLVDYVDDEMEIFILNLTTLRFWKAKEFFYENEIESFHVTSGVVYRGWKYDEKK